MKKITTLILATLLVVSWVSAQQVFTYNFENNLSETSGSGPDLTILGEQGVFETAVLNEISQQTKTVYRFAKNSGLQFNNAAAGNFIGTDYTIEIYFVFDELSSWKRVVDWKNRKTDWGAYVFNGKLNFYNILYSQEAPVLPGEFTYYVITRTAGTQQVLIYTDAQVKIDFIDNGNHALVDEDGVLNFFHDDLIVPNEASAGAVAMIRLYSYPLSQAQVTQNWEGLGSQVFGISKQFEKLPVFVYPNPAEAVVIADLSAFDSGKNAIVRLYDINGKQVYQTTATGGTRVEIGTGIVPAGIYLLHISQDTKIAASRVVVR